MNWKLIVQLSMFGLAMGLATVFFIPSSVEWVCWLVILVTCAYVIARNCRDKRFLHGLSLGVANSVWMTAAHILFFSRYLAGHPQEAEMLNSMPLPDSPRLMMGITGPVIGVVSGAVIGLFALIAGRFVNASR